MAPRADSRYDFPAMGGHLRVTPAHRFEQRMDPIEVTSLSRPDERWRYVDLSGHVHQWEWPDGRRQYRPDMTATVPTVHRVVTGTYVDEEGDEWEEAELRCVQCEAPVSPGSTADTNRQYIAGPTFYYVDDESVSREEYERLWNEARNATGE